QRDRAIGDYRAATSLDVGNSRARLNMGVVHLNASRSGLAFTEFDDIERTSTGQGERLLASFNLGVAAATAGELARAEVAFTRALDIITKQGGSRDVAKLVTPAACLANRGLVRFVMKRFSDATADLRGTPVNPTHKTSRILPPPCAGGAVHGGKGATPAVAATATIGTTTFAGGALDTLDCELGRALAEGRLENRSSREAARNRLRKLLRTTRLLPCEVASVRIGLGNLEATKGATGKSDTESTPAAAGTDGDGKEGPLVPPRHLKRQEAMVGAFLTDPEGSCINNGRAVRHFMHAIHTCPTASAAWLNASEALETIIHHGCVSTRDEASGVARQNACSDSVAAAGVGILSATDAPSLALVDAVLSMAPTHQTALRCRATTLARVGRTFEALLAADRLVSAAENAVRVAARKGVDVSSNSTTALRTGQVSAAGRDGRNKTLPWQPVRPATGSGRRLERQQQCSTPAKPAVDACGADTNTNAATGVTTSDAAHTCSTATGDLAGPCGVERNKGVLQGSIGFMRSSKVTVVVGGGLLLTGGGRVNALDIAKSLVLRGCLRQKMGRRDQAEQDYRRALGVCHSRLREIQGHHVDAGLSNDSSHPKGMDRHDEGRNDGIKGGHSYVLEGRGGQWSGFRQDIIPADAASGEKDSVAQAGCSDDPPSLRKTRGRCEGPLDSEVYSNRQEGIREVLKLERLVHHNLTALHIAAVLGTDIRVSLRKAAIAREASEFVATDDKVIATRQPASIRRSAQCRHERWWSSTVLAVASMVSETGWAVPWRDNSTTYGNDHNAMGKIARFQLGSAEIAAAISSGYDTDDDKVCALPTPLSLTGTARSRALLAVRVNLAAAEKIGALSGTGQSQQFRPINQKNRQTCLAQAVASLSSAISLSPVPSPELYIERGGLFAMMDAGVGGKNGRGGEGGGEKARRECANDYGKAAASDFATALWLDLHHLQGQRH
ncbi:unnamed protein product, partial [Hapterophycus canaliculatus]